MKTTLSILLSVLVLSVVACGNKEKKDAAGEEPFAAGKALFETKTCITCHGADGKGDTPTGKAIKARNLQTEAFKQGDTVKKIVKTIMNGVPGTGMAGFKGQVTEPEARKLARFVLSLRKK